MGIGEQHHHLLNFHLHHPHGKKDHDKMRNNIPPKGCLTILVGHEGGQQQKFVIPVIYINHPLFMQLLKEAEEEYGFDQKGPITLPCHVEEFQTVQNMIDQDQSLHHHHHHVPCFRT